ncbi:MAG: copper resistance protein CopZ [Azospirillum sp.]|nr:copper resistance protein CopZ [Azospirillum sp.]
MPRVLLVLLVVVLSACDGGPQAAAPPPQEPGETAVGHYCGMQVTEHPGPKGQIFRRSDPAHPFWFTSVRDAIAFTLLPEEPKDISVIYVNDMGRARNWQHPEPGTWIEAHAAWFVIGSARRGGMGAPEVVPFGSPEAAEAFVGAEGGRVVRFAAVPPDYVLGSASGEEPR